MVDKVDKDRKWHSIKKEDMNDGTPAWNESINFTKDAEGKAFDWFTSLDYIRTARGGYKSLVTLPCNHRFCTNCLMKWMKVKPNCPMCRREFVLVAKHSS